MSKSQQEPIAASLPATKTALIVEDDLDLGEFLTQALNYETPHTVYHATNAAHALEVVGLLKPNLFILDYLLPGIDGLELSDRLHAIKGFESVPTIMLSVNPPARQELERRHITLLKKPFELDALLGTIEQLLAQREG